MGVKNKFIFNYLYSPLPFIPPARGGKGVVGQPLYLPLQKGGKVVSLDHITYNTVQYL